MKSPEYLYAHKGTVKHLADDWQTFCGIPGFTRNMYRVFKETKQEDLPICKICLKEDARRMKPVWEKPFFLEPSPEGLTLSWVDLNSVHAAMKKAIDERPPHTILSTYAENVWKRIDRRKKQNDLIIEHQEIYGKDSW